MKGTDSEFNLFHEEVKITKKDNKQRDNFLYLLKDSLVGGP